MSKKVSYLSPELIKKFFEGDKQKFLEARGRARHILKECESRHTEMLFGTASGYETTKQDIVCLDYVGRAIYLLKHEWWLLSEEELFYCALLGSDYDTLAGTVALGNFPSVFNSKQARASAQKKYRSGKQKMFNAVRDKFISFFDKMSNLASLCDRKDLQSEFLATVRKLKARDGLTRFKAESAFFTHACILKVSQSLEHAKFSRYQEALTIAVAVDSRYKTHCSIWAKSSK